METLLGEMKNAGAEIVDPADIPTIGKFDESELTVFLYELKADLARTSRAVAVRHRLRV